MNSPASRFERTFNRPTLRDAAALRQSVEDEFRYLGAATYDAAIVVTELFTNAVRHGRSPVTVQAVPFARGVQVRVHDCGDRLGPLAADSRGLQLIERIARAWGVDELDDGKIVWADIVARPWTKLVPVGDDITGFSAVCETRSDAVVIRVTGEVDLSNADRLAACFEKACAAGKPRVVFDVTAVTYADSSAVHVLTRAAERCGELGIHMSVVGAQPAVRRVFELTDAIQPLHVDEYGSPQTE